MTRIPLTLLTPVILVAPAAHAQESARARAQRTLPADVFANVSALAVEHQVTVRMRKSETIGP